MGYVHHVKMITQHLFRIFHSLIVKTAGYLIPRLNDVNFEDEFLLYVDWKEHVRGLIPASLTHLIVLLHRLHAIRQLVSVVNEMGKRLHVLMFGDANRAIK